MKNRNLTFLKIAMVAVLGIATAVGCKKDQVVETKEDPKVESKSEISIEVLRQYFASRITAKLEWITYDEKTEMFRLHGVDQVSKKDLTESYQRNFLKINP